MNILTLKSVKAAVFIINNHFGRSGIVSIYPNLPIMSVSKMWR